MPVSSKVAVGATAGAATAGPAVVLLWLLSLIGVPPPPPEVAVILAAWASSGVGFLAAYLKRELNLPANPAPAQQQGATP